MRLALMIDSGIWEKTASGVDPAHELAWAIVQYIPETRVFSIGQNYEQGVHDISAHQNEFDCLVVICFSFSLFKFDGMFKPIRVPVVILEHDAYKNYKTDNPFFGKWSEYLRTNDIALIGVSGLFPYHKLIAEGFDCFYLPKAAPERFLRVKNSYSGRICAFGTIGNRVYWEREEVFRKLAPPGLVAKLGLWLPSVYWFVRLLGRRDNIDLLRFHFGEMPRILHNYSGCVICDRGLREPMAKHFEASALSLVPIRDDESVEELEELGYKEGVSMVVYRSIDDLVEKIKYYFQNPEDLVRLQDGARKAASQNTWRQRAITLREILKRRL